MSVGNQTWDIGRVKFQSVFGSLAVQLVLVGGSCLLPVLLVCVIVTIICCQRGQKRDDQRSGRTFIPDEEDYDRPTNAGQRSRKRFIPEGEYYLSPTQSPDDRHWQHRPTLGNSKYL